MTAETAVVLPVLIMVFVVALWGLHAASAQLACIDAARAAARAAARGEPLEVVRAAAVRAAPRDARVDIQREARIVMVRVTAAVTPAGGLLDAAPSLRVQGSAAAMREDVR